MMRYIWLARSRPMRHLLVAWCACYAGDLAAFTAASVYACGTCSACGPKLSRRPWSPRSPGP